MVIRYTWVPRNWFVHARIAWPLLGTEVNMQQSESTVAHDPYAAKQPVRTGMLRGLVLLMCLMAQGSAGGAFQRWLNRLRVGVFTVVGLYLLGAPIDRTLTVGAKQIKADYREDAHPKPVQPMLKCGPSRTLSHQTH